MIRGTPCGYFPEPTKSILVVSSWNASQAEALFGGYGLQIVMGSRHLGGFVGSKVAKDFWLGAKVEGWWYSVVTLAGVVRWHPQTAYGDLHKSLHQ